MISSDRRRWSGTVISILAIVAISVLEILALANGFNGTSLSVSCGAIGGVAGYFLRGRRHVGGKIL